MADVVGHSFRAEDAAPVDGGEGEGGGAEEGEERRSRPDDEGDGREEERA